MTEREQIKRAKANIGAWRNSRYSDIHSAYDRCSQAKRDAWRRCQSLCADMSGEGLRVISRNCHKFTAGFSYTSYDELGNGTEMFCYISPSYTIMVTMGD